MNDMKTQQFFKVEYNTFEFLFRPTKVHYQYKFPHNQKYTMIYNFLYFVYVLIQL